MFWKKKKKIVVVGGHGGNKENPYKGPGGQTKEYKFRSIKHRYWNNKKEWGVNTQCCWKGYISQSWKTQWKTLANLGSFESLFHNADGFHKELCGNSGRAARVDFLFTTIPAAVPSGWIQT